MSNDSWCARELSDDEFDALSASHVDGGFQQTSAMRRMVAVRGLQSALIGLTDESGKPVAGAMIAYTPSRLGFEGSIWLGPLCDPHNTAMLQAMTKAIADDARSRHAISVSCWPDDVYRLHDSDGGPSAAADDAMMTSYAAAGWKHGGFTRGYDSVINRWVYVKDLTGFADADALLASYSKNTRRNVKIARNSGVEVRKMTRDELGTFHDICEMSSVKQHFANRSLEYFQRVFDMFGDDAEFIIAEVHLDRYLASWQDKVAKGEKDVARLTKSLQTTKYPDDVRKKLDTANKNLEASRKRVVDANERIARDGRVVPVAAGLFMWHKRELVYFSSGSDERYAKFYAPTAIQHEMMSRCLERGITRYNFYGIDGVFDDPNSAGRGVLEFKQGFNGYVEELAGEFTLPVNKLLFFLKETAAKLLKR